MNFQEMIAKLTQFWAEQGCVVHQGYDLEVGAGTFNPATFLRCLGPEPYKAVYVEPSRRPKDGRYGENPNRVQFYHQMQVILKPSPENLQELYIQSLVALGLDLSVHDIRFVHDDWENPTIGAWGLGWEVWLDGMEVTQFTYFQAVGGFAVKPVSGELTYGLERLAMYLQQVDSIFDLLWNGHIRYGDIYKRSEWEWSHYNFHQADTALWHRHFDDFEAEAKRLAAAELPIPAYDFVMKASHAFNLLDARGVISVTERTGYIARIRALAKQVAETYVASREKLQFPLLLPEAIEEGPKVEAKASPLCDPEEKQDFLLEIGSEELPATFVPIGLGGLERALRALFKKHSLEFEDIATYGTPRRLAALVRGLSGGTKPQVTERKGPMLGAAFDATGAPTQVGEGFLRSVGKEPAPLNQLSGVEVRSIKGVDYLFARLDIPGVSTRALLEEELAQLILSIDFPKKMRWGNLDIEYARPLRTIVALFGTEVIPLRIGTVHSGRHTFGHRQLSPALFEVARAADYVESLREHKVMVDVAERKQCILDQLQKIEKEQGAVAVFPERVMPQVLHLVEWPFLTTATFDPNFLRAPSEVLISEMIEHQKYFPLQKKGGELAAAFVIVCNNTPHEQIQKGNQKALAPRLADGLFLYEEDLKTPLSQFAEKLKAITFQKELGSMWEKVERLCAYSAMLHAYLPLCSLSTLERAASLAKADLATNLVGEFPQLQGLVGKRYALHHGEELEVAQAIDEHWMPRGEKGPLPASGCGQLLGLAEKIDNFLSFFSLGMQPSSSSDPYGLRRQGLGFVRILVEGKHFLPLPQLLSEAFDRFILSIPTPLDVDKTQALEGITQFLMARLRTVLLESAIHKEEIEAVLAHPHRDLYDIFRLAKSLHTFREEKPEKFASALEVHTRSRKILFSQKAGLIAGWKATQHATAVHEGNRFPLVRTELLGDETEKKLYALVKEMSKEFHLKWLDRRDPHKRDYPRAFARLAELQEPLAAFFEAVKVLDDDLSLRTNRLALLQETWDLTEELLDFTALE